ncbi:MAG TPA: polysaccharide deacetylase family protein [Solirubrobacterales bacterium]|nr:polysaccharide deacetylase family protein [Solirubrobacterales bacterium]
MPDARQLRRAVRGAIPRPLRQRLYDWSPSRRRRWRRAPGVESVPAGAGAVLSFDDGPDPEGTPPVLEALGACGARGTFFVLGRHVAERPELAREIVEGGHEIALHGMDHRRHDRLSEGEAERELSDGVAAVEAAVGRRPAWYRPPFGASSPTLAAVCERLGLGLAYWTAWGQDWEESSAERIASLVERDLAPGAVVLLHDSARYAQRGSAAATAGAVPLIAAAAAEAGLDLVTLSAATGDAG